MAKFHGIKYSGVPVWQIEKSLGSDQELNIVSA